MKITKDTVLAMLNESWDALDEEKTALESDKFAEDANLAQLDRCMKGVDLLITVLRDDQALMHHVLKSMTARDVARG